MSNSFIDDVSLNTFYNTKEEELCEICSCLLTDTDKQPTVCNVCYGILHHPTPRLQSVLKTVYTHLSSKAGT